MADLQPTDVLLVNRAGVDYSVPQSDVMADVLDTDLLLVNRAGVDYQATYADVRKGFGAQYIDPAPGDWTFNPAIAGGTGSQADPYIITPETVTPAGGTVQSAQTLTLTGLNPNDLVGWTDNSVGAGNRFDQPLSLVPASGQVDLKLNYLDTPDSTATTVYTGDLQIGTTYFRWVVTQAVAVAPVIDTVVLADSPEAERFTSATFATTVTMTEDGVPASTKGLKAWVEGTLKVTPLTSAITNVGAGPIYSNGVATSTGSFKSGNPATNGFDGNAATFCANSAVGVSPIGTDWVEVTFTPALNVTSTLDFLFWDPEHFQQVSINGGAYQVVPASVAPSISFTGTVSTIRFSSIEDNRGAGSFSGVGYDGAILVDGATTLTLTDSTDLALLTAGDAVTEVGNGDDATGTVGVVDITARTIALSASSGTWDVGSQVKGPQKTVTTKPESDVITGVNTSGPQPVLTFATDKDLAVFSAGDAVNQEDSAASGTVGSIDATAKTMTLATSTGTWGPANAGHYVIGPDKPAANVKLYTVHDAAGAVSDLQSYDPGYVTMAGNSPYTLTFPATFPTGNAPDTDLPAGTTLTTEIQAANTSGTDVKTSNTVTPT